jgi:hypothetical protein
MKKMGIKIVVIMIVVLGTIYYLDASKLFSFDEDHVEKRWNGLYKFTSENEIDLLILGNSKTYCGINPITMSSRLGLNTFVLATPNGSLTQCYYNLREALTICKPKMVAIEVTPLNSSTMVDKEGSGKSFLYKDFDARRNVYEKVITTPQWFDIEEYAFAWSTSIRNHNFLFTNTEQIEKNKEKAKKEVVNNKLYLGRYVRFTSGIKDSILNKYETDGPSVNGDSLTISDEQLNSLQLLIDLLEDNNVQPVFFTIPVYKDHIENYDTRYELLSDLIEKKHGYELFDFQQFYQEDVLTAACFENTYEKNQHMTYLGSVVITYNLSDSIQNSPQSLELTNRKGEQLWHNIFYGEESYFYNNPMILGNKVLFVQNEIVTDNCTIKEVGIVQEEKVKIIMAKIPKSCISEREKEDLQVQMIVDVKIKGEAKRIQVNLPFNKYHRPSEHYVYSIPAKDIEFIKILQTKVVNTKLSVPTI